MNRQSILLQSLRNRMFLVFTLLLISVPLNITMSAEPTKPSVGNVGLIVDYSNGVQKSFMGIPWKADMAVVDVLDAADLINPGLKFKFATSFVDRGGRDVGSIVSVDGVEAGQPDQKWLVWVNKKFIGTKLTRVTPASVSKFGLPLVEPGDIIVLKLSTGP